MCLHLARNLTLDDRRQLRAKSNSDCASGAKAGENGAKIQTGPITKFPRDHGIVREFLYHAQLGRCAFTLEFNVGR